MASKGISLLHSDEKSKLTYMEALLKVSTALISSNDFDACLDTMLHTMGETASVSRTYIFQNNDEKQTVTNTHEWVAPGVSSEKDNMIDLPWGIFPDTFSRLERGEHIIANDITTLHDELQEILTQQDIASIVFLPIVVRDDFFGFIGFDVCHEQHLWTEAEVDFLRNAAQLVAAAFQRKQDSEALCSMNEQLLESEERYQSIVKHSQDAVYVHDLKGNMIDCNAAGLEMIGYSKEEVIGSHMSKFLSADSLQVASQSLAQKAEGGVLATAPYDLEIIKKDGSTLIVEVTSMTYTKAHKIVGVIGLARDVTEVRKAARIEQKRQFELNRSVRQLEKRVESLSDRKPQLTEKERQMLYYFCCHPTLSDNQLALHAKIKRSTITAIRNRLLKEGYLTIHNVPNLNVVAESPISVIVGNYSHQLDSDVVKQLTEMVKSEPSDIFFFSTETEFILITMSSKDAPLISYLESENLLDNSYKSYTFNKDSSIITRLFDHSSVLHRFFKIPEAHRGAPIRKPHAELSRNEKRILCALVEFPMDSILDLSKKLHLSKPTVSSIKRKLIEKGFIIPTVIPHVEKLGCELLVLNYSQMSKGYSCDVQDSSIVSITDTGVSLSLDLFRDYYDFKNHEISKEVHSKGAIRTESRKMLLSHSEAMYLNFMPFVKQFFNFGDEY